METLHFSTVLNRDSRVASPMGLADTGFEFLEGLRRAPHPISLVQVIAEVPVLADLAHELPQWRRLLGETVCALHHCAGRGGLVGSLRGAPIGPIAVDDVGSVFPSLAAAGVRTVVFVFGDCVVANGAGRMALSADGRDVTQGLRAMGVQLAARGMCGFVLSTTWLCPGAPLVLNASMPPGEPGQLRVFGERRQALRRTR